MNIYEITRPNNIDKAAKILKKKGYKQLGASGSFASVYWRPDEPFVLKLFSSKDKSYLSYLNLITRYYNIHFPVLKGKPTQVSDDYWAIRLEKLEPLNEVGEKLRRMAKSYMEDYTNLGYYQKRYMNIEKEVGAGKQISFASDFDNPRIQINMLRNSLNRFEKYYPELAEALRLIVEYLVFKGRSIIDLHQYNAMMRGNVLVITDPTAFADDVTNISNNNIKQYNLPLDFKGTTSGTNKPKDKELELFDIDHDIENDPIRQPSFPYWW